MVSLLQLNFQEKETRSYGCPYITRIWMIEHGDL